MSSFSRHKHRYRNLISISLVALILIGYWLVPIHGQVLIVPENWHDTNVWPRIGMEAPQPGAGQHARISVTDNVPWAYVYVTVAGKGAQFEHGASTDQDTGLWSWSWSFTPPDSQTYDIVFYHDCDTGCIERGRVTVGLPATTSELPNPPINTKLGVVFADPQRDWHGRSAWDVELTYVTLANEGYWGIDALAERVHAAKNTGLRVLVRVDYDKGQSLPPADNYDALNLYLKYLQRLARDERLREVYAYIIGSGFNTKSSNQADSEHLVTPEWYARVFNGYSVEPGRSDNVVETMRAENPMVRILVGPVRPWANDQNGENVYRVDAAWLNYMNTLVAALNASAETKASHGIPLAAPDGFAVQASGRPEAPELAGRAPANEPRIDLPRPAWQGAQAGFRVYRDWLDIINAYPHTRGLPVFITSTNTFTPDTNIPPAQNYPRGWLSTALDVINNEPQVLALCWFIDGDFSDTQWELYRLSNPRELMVYAAEEFDKLLQVKP